MKFPKNYLLDILDGQADSQTGLKEGILISDNVYDTSRWTIQHEIIFQVGQQFFESVYSVGATEYQDESPWEYEGDMIDCKEVFRKEKIVIVYE